MTWQVSSLRVKVSHELGQGQCSQFNRSVSFKVKVSDELGQGKYSLCDMSITLGQRSGVTGEYIQARCQVDG